MDGITPECMAGKDCPIPALDEAGHRIMQVRNHLIGLQPTVDAGTICRIHGVDKDDLDLLLVVERETKENQPDGA